MTETLSVSAELTAVSLRDNSPEAHASRFRHVERATSCRFPSSSNLRLRTMRFSRKFFSRPRLFRWPYRIPALTSIGGTCLSQTLRNFQRPLDY